MVSGSGISLSTLIGEIPFQYSIYTFLAVILLIYLIRLLRAAIGEKFSETRVFFTPVLYSILVTISFISSTQSEIILASIDAIIGIALGIVFSKKVHVFKKKGKLYYRRSLIVVTLWTAFFSLKLISILYYPQFDIKVFFSVGLTLFTGMVVGEALRIFYKYRSYEKNGMTDSLQDR